MKRYPLFMACGIAMAAMLASCSGSQSGKPLSELKASSASDTVSYYYGELMADRMVQMGRQDSIYKTQEMRDAYWEGFRKGFDLIKKGDTDRDRAYNEGLTFGMQLAGNFRQTQTEIPEFKFNMKMFESGYNYAFKGDSASDIMTAQQELDKTMNDMSRRAQEANKAKLESEMAAYASKNGFTKDAYGYYEKTEKKADGNALAVGDSLTLAVEFNTNKGKNMYQYNMPPTPLVLGKSMPMEYPYAKVLTTMHSGSVVKLLMLPGDIFGQAASSFRLAPDEFIIVTLKPEFIGKTSFTLPQKAEQPQPAQPVK